MDDAFERVLRLVADGRLTAEEAAPILDALGGPAAAPDGPTASTDGSREPAGDGAERASGSTPRFARIEVREGGKRVVDLRIPISLGRLALGRVPGLSAQHIADVEDAVAAGSHGPILDVEDPDGSGVRILLE
jgi:hypothetical protein